MENFDLLNNDLQVSPQSQNYLTESAKWGRFLAIMGFIFCGIMAVFAFVLPSFILKLPPYNSMPATYSTGVQAALTVVYLFFGLLLFFPCLYLYRFSVKMQTAVKSVSQENFEESLMNLKSMFKFYGILTIILLSFYILIFVVAMIGLAVKG
ncbi:MAG: DUF5362 family protein [Ginsengibacter sp.]